MRLMKTLLAAVASAGGSVLIAFAVIPLVAVLVPMAFCLPVYVIWSEFFRDGWSE